MTAEGTVMLVDHVNKLSEIFMRMHKMSDSSGGVKIDKKSLQDLHDICVVLPEFVHRSNTEIFKSFDFFVSMANMLVTELGTDRLTEFCNVMDYEKHIRQYHQLRMVCLCPP